MSAKILDGRILSARIQDRLIIDIAALKEKTGETPRLINLMVGDNTGSMSYAKAQERAARQIGMRYQLIRLSTKISQDVIVEQIRRLNEDPDVNGIMIHKPLPKSIDYLVVANTVDPQKDIEGIHVSNLGQMLLKETRIIPCTPAAVMEHLRSTGMDLYGKEAVIIGASEIVGKPLSLLLLREMATVTVCHIATTQAGRLEGHVRQAEILIVAVGKARLIKGEWIKPKAVVIDVGINKLGDKIVGDVEFESASRNAAYITPVPGGVGPVTVMMLMRNGIKAFALQKMAA